MGNQSDHSIIVGEIDRISGSGNAMLDRGGYNLGPLPREVVGNKAIAIPLSGTWAICLTPFIDRETYLSDFVSTNGTPGDRNQIECAIENIQLSTANGLNHLTTRPSGPVHSGTTIDAQITVSGPNVSYVFFEDGTGAELDIPFLPPGIETTIEVTKPSSPIMSARIAESILDDAPDPESKLTLEVLGTKGSDAYASYDSIPIRLPGCPASAGDHIHASIISKEKNHLKAGLSGLPASDREEVGNTFEVDLQLTPDVSDITLVHEGTPIQILTPESPIESVVPLKVTGVETNSITAKVDFTKISNSKFEVGEELLVDDLKRYDARLIGQYDGIPISIEVSEHPAALPDSLTIIITAISPDEITARIKVEFEEGEKLPIEHIERRERGIVGQYNGVPVLILAEEKPPALPDSLDVTIAEISATEVIAEINPDFEVGDGLTVTDIERRDDRFVGQYNGIPVVLSPSDLPPAEPDILDAVVTNVSKNEILASIRSHTRLESIEAGSIITVEIDRHEHNHLIGKYKGFPVWVPHDGKIIPHELTVAVTKITDLGIFASFDNLPEETVPEAGEIVPARIESVDQSTAVAWVEVTEDIDSYALPVVVPMLLNPHETVGVEIVDNSTYPLTGIVQSSNVGEAVTPVSGFERDTQLALVSLYDQSHTDAAVAWESALDSANSLLRKVTAKRSVTYGQAEKALNKNQADVSESLLEEFQEYVKSAEIPIQYEDQLLSESRAYKQLITASREGETPGSATDLQRIWYNFDIRNQVDNAAADLPTSSQIVSGEWTPVFPHPFVVNRLRQLCSQFESAPDAAKRVLDSVPTLSETRWTIPPSEDSTRRITIDILPFSPEMSTHSVKSEKSDGDTTEIEEETRTESDVTPEGNATNPSSLTKSSGYQADQTGEDLSDSTYSDETTSASENETSVPETTPLSERDQSTITPKSGEKHTEEDDSASETNVITAPKTTKRLRKLRQKAEEAASDDPVRDTSQTVVGSRYQRAEPIKDYVKTRADGICEGCKDPAPFDNADGEPYLEAHHVDELGKGGEDHPAKVVALCPTCHKRVHHGQNGGEFNDELRQKLRNGLADIGAE